MIIADMLEACSMKLITGNASGEVRGVYTCDLLSHAALHVQKGDAWITVINNINIVAVAAVTNAVCVILPEDIEIPPHVKDKAIARGITVISSPLTASDIIVKIHELLKI